MVISINTTNRYFCIQSVSKQLSYFPPLLSWYKLCISFVGMWVVLCQTQKTHAPTRARRHCRTGTFLFLCFLYVLLSLLLLTQTLVLRAGLFSSGRIGVFGQHASVHTFASAYGFYKWTLDLPCGAGARPVWYIVYLILSTENGMALVVLMCHSRWR